jgi:predicted Zn-dependent peptidase
MDLRESKHWSYGAFGYYDRAAFAAPYIVQAPVQANQTGPSIAALQQDVRDYVTTKPMTDGEFDLAINGAIRSASGQFETAGAVLRAMQQNDLYKRPDDYYATIAQRYRALTLPQLRQATAAAIDPSRITWIVVGEGATVRPQLDRLGMPVEVMTASSLGLPAAAPAPTPAK